MFHYRSNSRDSKASDMNKTTITFPSRELWCEADLYFPGEVECPPVVVMGHGYGAERDFGTHSTIAALCSAGAVPSGVGMY